VLVNHLKSKGFGNQHDNDARRLRQAARVAEIYKALRDAGHDHIAVIGDLNDTDDRPPLTPLIDDTDLKDVTTSPKFVHDKRPGTFGNATKTEKIDYILLSPALLGKVTAGAIFRKGAWGGKHGDLWDHYPTITSPAEAASDHAAIYADLDV
jgi:endonuclease/exonuclease/phosphatase family metal-dependent hydrolase